MKPIRIQRRRTRGWKMPPNTVYVGRPTCWGNPYTIAGAREADYRGTDDELRQLCVDMFARDWLDTMRSAAQHPRHPPMPFGKPLYLGPLKGKNLACWCRLDHPCHADVLLKLANADDCSHSSGEHRE